MSRLIFISVAQGGPGGAGRACRVLLCRCRPRGNVRESSPDFRKLELPAHPGELLPYLRVCQVPVVEEHRKIARAGLQGPELLLPDREYGCLRVRAQEHEVLDTGLLHEQPFRIGRIVEAVGHRPERVLAELMFYLNRYPGVVMVAFEMPLARALCPEAERDRLEHAEQGQDPGIQRLAVELP